jgi:hypothetical protein
MLKLYSLVVSLNNTATLYREVYKYGITWTSLRISTVWWGAIVPVAGGGGLEPNITREKYHGSLYSSTDKWISWRWFSSEQRITKKINAGMKLNEKESLPCNFILTILKCKNNGP